MAGTEETARSSFAILNELMRVLMDKGILTDKEVFALVEAAAVDLDKGTGHAGKNAAYHIRNCVLPGLKN
jgi:hypothetical protein